MEVSGDGERQLTVFGSQFGHNTAECHGGHISIEYGDEDIRGNTLIHIIDSVFQEGMAERRGAISISGNTPHHSIVNIISSFFSKKIFNLRSSRHYFGGQQIAIC